MGEWKEYKLGDVAEIIKDSYIPDGSNKYAYIGLEHIEQATLRLNSVGVSSDVTSNKFKFKASDILFGKLRPYFRKVVKPQFEGICSTDIWVFRATRNSDQNFLFYFLANWDFVNTANNADSGTRMPRADWDYLKDTEWSLPSLPEQKSIASILNSLDDKIDLLHRQNKTLEALAETLFRQWFVEEAEEGWENGKLGDYILFTKGKKPSDAVEDHLDGLAPQILIETFDTGKTLFSNPDNMIIASEKDILMVMDGASSGRVEIGFAGIVGSTIGLYKPLAEFNYPLFIYLLLRFYKDHIQENTTGSAIPHADKALILNLDIQYPNIERVIEFENMAEVWFEKKKANRNQIRTLTRLRDTLLPKLMSGAVRVKNINRSVERKL